MGSDRTSAAHYPNVSQRSTSSIVISLLPGTDYPEVLT